MAARERTGTSGRVALLGLAVGITATAVAWGVLVLAAIDFGRDARAGDGEGWLFLTAATIGAIACMFLAIIFASRLGQRLRGGRMERTVSSPVTSAEDGVRPGDVVDLEPASGSPSAPAAQAPVPTEDLAAYDEAAGVPKTFAWEADGLAPATATPSPPAALADHTSPETAPGTYRSKHSRASAEPETEESTDSPAASYRGKRAAR